MGTVWMLLRKVATLSVEDSGTTSAWVSVFLVSNVSVLVPYEVVLFIPGNHLIFIMKDLLFPRLSVVQSLCHCYHPYPSGLQLKLQLNLL